MAGHGKGSRRGGHEEEHENHERWLVSYADMMTLLMVLFIVMFAISAVDQKKFAALKDGLATGFGSTESMPMTAGVGISDNGGVLPSPIDIGIGAGVGPQKPTEDPAGLSRSASAETVAQAAAGGAGTKEAALKEIQRLTEIEAKIRRALAAKGLAGDVRFKVTERGLVVALLSDDVFFESASATLRPRGKQVLAAIEPTIRALPNDIAIEGHANHLAVTSSLYPTNWELSAARAAGVVRWLSDRGGLRETRLSASGYGSSRPLYKVSDKRAVRFNRRVDVVLVSNQAPDVRALLPQLAPQLTTF
jgi:chemotaxis protein MotB